MRNIIKDTLYFVFHDTDGTLSFSIKAYDGEPVNPCFLYDGDKQVLLMRCPGQVVCLADLSDESSQALRACETVRLVETPEDSSEILRQYDVPVTRIENILLADSQMVYEDFRPAHTA